MRGSLALPQAAHPVSLPGFKDAQNFDLQFDHAIATHSSLQRRNRMSRRTSLSRAWWEAASSSMEMMQGAAVVIGKRTTAMSAMGANSSAAEQCEMRRMVEEKVSASAQAWSGITLASASVFQSMAAAALFNGHCPTNAQLQRAALKVVGAATQPYRTKVRENVKRLGRK